MNDASDTSQADMAINPADVGKLLTAREIDRLFDLRYHTKHVDTIFRRVFED
jgi:adenylosuccinate lyase